MEKHIVYKHVRDFSNKQITIIALRYANTPYNYGTRAIAVEFSRDGEYAILPRTISKLIQKAIKTALVNEDIAKKIREKAVYNSSFYSKTSGEKTRALYTSLIMQRREFIENGYKPVKKKKDYNFDITTKIAEEQKAKEKLTNLENSLKTLKHQIEIFDEVNEEEITLDSLLSQKSDLERQIRHIKCHFGL